MMATISSGSDTGVVHDYDPGTGDTSGIIVVGNCDSGTALGVYSALHQIGMNVCLVERDPDPDPEPLIRELRSMDIPACPELYRGAPHRVPNHYPPAPPKIQFKSTTLAKPKITIKQPMARMGFRRGNRG